MADEINEEKKEEKKEQLDEDYTSFGGGSASQAVGYNYGQPSGPIGRFLSKFFATKAQPALKDTLDGKPTTITGDTIIDPDVIRSTDAPVGAVSRNPLLPQRELNRKKRYKEYEEMDEYPEIGAAFDIYADDSTQKNIKHARWTIDSDNSLVVEEVDDLFRRIKMDRLLWDITRNTVKYGDCFVEMILNIEKPKEGLKKIKILNPNFILRVENEYGYLKEFIQEVPDDTSVQGYNDLYMGQKILRYIHLDKNQIVHFRLHSSDPNYYPYGKSIAFLCHRIFRSLKMMEDAMLIYRLTRAPERRIFYVDVGSLPTSKAEMYIERLKEKFKKEKFYNTQRGTVDARFNPLSTDEDYFVPTRGAQGTKIDTLPGATNLSEIEDVRYYRDKLLAALKIPKDYMVEKDQSPERKANLSQLDVKFARVIQRVQKNVEVGLENLAKRHLQLKGFPAGVIRKLRIHLPEPSDMSEKRKLDIDEQRLRIVQGIAQLGMFAKEAIYKEWFQMTDVEVAKMKRELKKDQEEMPQQPMVGGGGMAGPAPGEAGTQEPAENVPPTANNEEKIRNLEKVGNKLVLEDKEKEILDRVIEKQRKNLEKVYD